MDDPPVTRQPAPGALALVQDFVNTAELPGGLRRAGGRPRHGRMARRPRLPRRPRRSPVPPHRRDPRAPACAHRGEFRPGAPCRLGARGSAACWTRPRCTRSSPPTGCGWPRPPAASTASSRRCSPPWSRPPSTARSGASRCAARRPASGPSTTAPRTAAGRGAACGRAAPAPRPRRTASASARTPAPNRRRRTRPCPPPRHGRAGRGCSGSRPRWPNGLAGRAGSFGAAAAEYERGRPPYPPEAIDWLLPPSPRRVVDLGAGTGKLTRQLHERGLDVVAVEPSAGMREQLARLLPAVPLLDGTAEAIPLADASVDVVLVAQAWHWVDPRRALPEVARVLSPGGRLGLVWNIRDERVDWVKQLGDTMHGDDDPRAACPRGGWAVRAPANVAMSNGTYHIAAERLSRPGGLAQLRDHAAAVGSADSPRRGSRAARHAPRPCRRDGDRRARTSPSATGRSSVGVSGRRRAWPPCPSAILRRRRFGHNESDRMQFDHFSVALLILRADAPALDRGRGDAVAGRAHGPPRRPARRRPPAGRRASAREDRVVSRAEHPERRRRTRPRAQGARPGRPWPAATRWWCCHGWFRPARRFGRTRFPRSIAEAERE